ncbi:hypothetical protein NF867_17480 [Solitalea sp. MAHUQ-68]|uniref:Uncharacterized protein n=1 Tax=Solitalea agri TaxID=2953739 RepID=A0A9X2F4P0_9SPHI|nr:hypothetical protein [Solitalea agri]MCO4294657.1 hypothetical protein [Solitalea agri]
MVRKKIESLDDLLLERARLESLKEQNELLIKQEIAIYKERLRPVTEIISLFSKAKSEEEKKTKRALIRSYFKSTVPYLLPLIGGPKVGILSSIFSTVRGILKK